MPNAKHPKAVALTKQQAIRLARNFIEAELPKQEWYQLTKPHIKAIVLYGSTAKGTNRPDSDIDLLVFMPLAIEEKYTTGEYVYPYEGREVNIVIRSIERLRHIAQEHTDAFQREVFKDAEIIQAIDAEASELVATISNLK